MSRYIEREAVMKTARDGYHSDFGKSMADLTSLREVLEDTPTADVVEVRRGRWLYEDSDIGWTDYKCYDCGNIISTVNQDEDLYSYCPYCGARMDGETND